MKNRILIVLGLLIIGISYNSCQKEPDLRMPDLIRASTSFDQIPALIKDQTVDFNLDFFNLETSKGIINIECTDPSLVTDAKIMVARNGMYNEASVYETVSSFPANIDVTATKIVAAMSGLSAIEDIQSGDKYRFYLQYSLNGNVVNTFDSEGNSDIAAGLKSVPDLNYFVDYNIVCPFVIEDYVGTYSCIQYDSDGALADGPYTVTVSLNETKDSLTVTGIVDNPWFGVGAPVSEFTFYVDPSTYLVSAPEASVVWGGNAYGAYGRIDFEVVEGSVNTCDYEVSITADVTLPESGYWFGRNTFVFKKVSKGEIIESNNIIEKGIPIKR